MDFIEIYKNAFSKENCKSAIDFFESSKSKTPGVIFDGTNKIINKEVKDSTDLTLSFSDRNEITNLVFECLNDNFYSYITKYPEIRNIMGLRPQNTFNIQRYFKGQGYSRIHCEHSSKSCISVMAWMIYLNTVDDGGTEFTNYNKILDCEEGSMVIWPAYWTHSHRGIISKSKTKYIITGWINFL